MNSKRSNILIQANSGYAFEGSTITEFNSDSSTWDIIPISSTIYRIQKKTTPYFLHASSDDRLILKELSEDDDAQNWQLEPVPNRMDYNFIISVKNNKALQDLGSIPSGLVVLFEFHRGPNQLWKFIDLSNIIDRSPEQRFYNSLNNFISKYPGAKYNFGDLFNSLIHHGDVFTRILCQLTMKELATLRLLCKQIYELLPDYWVYKKGQCRIEGDYNDVDKVLFKGPTVKNHILRIKIHLRWSDQGWGNEKTRLMFYLKRYGKIIGQYEFNAIHEVTEHYLILEDNDITSKTQNGDVIEVWRHVGGGGGHVMKLHFLKCVIELLK